MYAPPFSVGPTIVNLIAEISTHLGRFDYDDDGAESVLLRTVEATSRDIGKLSWISIK